VVGDPTQAEKVPRLAPNDHLMARFYRVMTEGEWLQVDANQRIDPSNREWEPYPPGTVVFLFREDTQPRRFQERADPLKESSVEAVLLIYFDASDSFATCPDRSGWESIGGVVHVGPVIAADTVDGFKMSRWL